MKITAKWITTPQDTDRAPAAFRKSFAPKGEVKKATLYASAAGVYAAYLNGARIGKGVLAPGFTNYGARVQYQEYDVTAMLQKENLLEIGVGVGWALGQQSVRPKNRRHFPGKAIIAWLEIVYADGTKETVLTDDSWDAYTTQVTYAEFYYGETVDKTLEPTYLGKAVAVDNKNKLVPQIGEWITEQERLAPVELIRTPKGEIVLDFGQNMTGYVEIRMAGKRGGKIVLHHAEVLDKEGNFYEGNMRSATNEVTYILSGEEEVYKPTYTFQGFRYVQLLEYPLEQVDLNAFRAIVVHSEMKRTGNFRCGNEKVNQLYHNIIWGQKGNYLDIPTDCPQRDERLGWTGDAQVFCKAAAINYDVEKFFQKWLGDVASEQLPDGSIYGIVPEVMLDGQRTLISAGWGDASCIIPWQMYLAYGNKKELKKCYPMMKKWVRYLRTAGPEEYLWLGYRHYGDWLSMDAGENITAGATSKDLIATAYFAYSTSLVIETGKVLGEDVGEFEELYGKVVAAFREYFMENGMPKEELPRTDMTWPEDRPYYSVKGITQTSLALILNFNLCTDEERPALAAKLVELIRDFGDRMSTGFIGTPNILQALSENGYTDVAYTLLLQEKNPSWLFSVNQGATTMWEHWDSIKEDGTFWSDSMNSFNHYAYGAVFDWIFSTVAGIRATIPGYKEIALEPNPNKALGFADTTFESRSGFIRSYWYYKGDTVYYEFTIPQGVTAILRLPSGYTATLTGGTYHFAE